MDTKKARFNMRMTHELELKLRRLASDERLSMTEVIEQLVEAEYAKRREHYAKRQEHRASR